MRRRKTCSNAQDWWNRTPGRVTLPPSATVGSPPQQAKPNPNRPGGQTKRLPLSLSLSPSPPLFSPLPPSLSLSPRPRDAAGTERNPPPRLAGDGWLRQLGRHRLESNRGTLILPFHCPCSAPLRSLARPATTCPPLSPALACPRERLGGASLRVPFRGEARGWGSQFGAGGGTGPTPRPRAAPLHAWAAAGVRELDARAGSRLVVSISC